VHAYCLLANACWLWSGCGSLPESTHAVFVSILQRGIEEDLLFCFSCRNGVLGRTGGRTYRTPAQRFGNSSPLAS